MQTRHHADNDKQARMSPAKDSSRSDRRAAHLREVQESDRQALGDEFRLARLQRGEDLAAIAAKLRIRADHLQAIEEGRFDDLPGQTYATGFLRTYSRHLGLDPNSVLDRYRRERRADSGGSTLYFPEPIREARRPRTWLVAVALVLLGGLYAAWYYGSAERRLAQEVSPLPDRLNNVASGTGPTDTHPAADGTAAPANAPLTGSQGSSVASSFPGPAANAPAAAPPANGPAPASAPARIAGAETGTSTAAPPSVGAPAAPANEAVPPAVTRGQGAPVYLQGNGDSAVAATGPSDWRSPPASAGATASSETGLAPNPAPDGSAVNTTAPRREPGARRPDLGNLIAAARKPGEPAAAPGPLASTAPETAPVASPGEGSTGSTGGVQQNIAPLHPVTTLHAKGPTWVQLEGEDGGVLLSRILQPGESYRLPDQPGLTLTTGNAGGLDIEVNGAHTGPMGPVGAVRRHISIDRLRADAR